MDFDHLNTHKLCPFCFSRSSLRQTIAYAFNSTPRGRGRQYFDLKIFRERAKSVTTTIDNRVIPITNT